MTKKNKPDTNTTTINNLKLRDSSSKIIFGDNTLSSQFLRDFADLEILRHVQPEDIEDVSDRYVPLYSTERNSDTVKRVDISKYLPPRTSTEGNAQDNTFPTNADGPDSSEDPNPLRLPLYVISLVEHKTQVEYNVIMQVLRYMVYIWEDYEKEMEKAYPGISKRKAFQYPPVLPIIYYEGTDNWTASTDLADRILYGELLGKYLPHFRYQIVMLHDYSNEALLEKGDEISLAMLINKIQTFEDVSAFVNLPVKQIGDIIKNTPDYLLGKISDVLRALLYRMELPEEKVEDTVAKVKERKMGMLFENIKINIPAEKRKAEAALQEQEVIRQELEICKHILNMTRNGHSDEEITKSLMQRFSLDAEQAREMLATY